MSTNLDRLAAKQRAVEEDLSAVESSLAARDVQQAMFDYKLNMYGPDPILEAELAVMRLENQVDTARLAAIQARLDEIGAELKPLLEAVQDPVVQVSHQETLTVRRRS